MPSEAHYMFLENPYAPIPPTNADRKIHARDIHTRLHGAFLSTSHCRAFNKFPTLPDGDSAHDKFATEILRTENDTRHIDSSPAERLRSAAVVDLLTRTAPSILALMVNFAMRTI